MSLKDKFIEFFNGLPEEEFSEITDPAVPVPSPDPTVRHEAVVTMSAASQAPTPTQEPDPEKVALMSRIEALETERRVERATNYVDGLIREGKLTPAARADFIATFSAAESVDASTESGLVLFSDGSRTSLTAALKRGLEALPKVVTFSEDVPAYALPQQLGGEGQVEDAEKKRARKEELLKMTPLGKQALARQTNGTS